MSFTHLPQYNPYKIATNCIVLVTFMWGGDDRMLLNAFASVLRSLSLVRLFATSWTVACQASLSMGFFPARILEWVAISSSRAFALTNGEEGRLKF